MNKHILNMENRSFIKALPVFALLLVLSVGVSSVLAFAPGDRDLMNTTALDPEIAAIESIDGLGLLCTDDVHGANDEPGQKDLTQMCVDSAANPIKLSFNWDEIYGGGANTYDACSMFDTDGDGDVNYSFCLTVEANAFSDIMEYKGISLYSCGNDKPDRCTQPVVLLTPSPGTACSAAQVSPTRS